MQECSKCKKDATGGSSYIEATVLYPFCIECTQILETFPNPILILNRFLDSEEKQSQVEKNIFDARKGRVKGHKFEWNQQM